MMRVLFTVLFICLFSTVFAQIAGVSNDKLVVVSPGSIGTRTFEFEPGFGYIWSKKTFDESGKLVSLNPENDSILVLQALAFRFTYGFAKNFEIGTSVTSTLDAFALGIKYTFVNKTKFLAGVFLEQILIMNRILFFITHEFLEKQRPLLEVLLL